MDQKIDVLLNCSDSAVCRLYGVMHYILASIRLVFHTRIVCPRLIYISISIIHRRNIAQKNIRTKKKEDALLNKGMSLGNHLFKRCIRTGKKGCIALEQK